MQTALTSGKATARTPATRGQRRPWVGYSYVHLAFPVPALDAEYSELLDRTLAADGWELASERPLPGEPVLLRRWGHGGGSSLVLLVLGWYPLVLTVGAEGPATPRIRRAERHVTTAVVEAGGREVADRELDELLGQCRARWQQALGERRTIEEQRRWLECRGCRNCAVWSAYGALHCRGCARRFAPEDDADRDERGREAAAIATAAEQRLASLGRGVGLFPDWPAALESAGSAELPGEPEARS